MTDDRVVDAAADPAGPHIAPVRLSQRRRRLRLVRRTVVVGVTAVVTLALAEPTASAAPAHRTICVDHRLAGCSKELQEALDMSRDGDTVRIGPGVFRGGVVIDKSVVVRGAGAGRTRIDGGAPVVTVGLGAGTTPPTVSIQDVTVSGGRVDSMLFDTVVRWVAAGAGVRILGRPDALGATVTIDRTVVENNVAVPSATIASPTTKVCPDGYCPYGQGAGAGIWNAGTLRLTSSIVRANRAGSVAGEASVGSDAQGAGIASYGPLLVDHSSVVDNESHVRPPNGRFGEGAGIFAGAGGLTVRHSTIAHNHAVLESIWPASVELQAVGGGIFVEGDFTADPNHAATIEWSRIVDNEARATNTTGNAIAFSGGVQGVGQVTIDHSVVSGNRVVASIPAGSAALADADSGGGNLNVGAVISHSRLVDNTVTATAPDGVAVAMAGGMWAWADDPLHVQNSQVSGNRVSASGQFVLAQGAGVVNTDVLDFADTAVSDNAARADGARGETHGGGIYNGYTAGSEDYTPRLSLTGVAVLDNVLQATSGVAVSGGGLFTAEPVTMQQTTIRANRPDDVVGPPAAAAAVERAVAAAPRAALGHRGHHTS